VQSRAPALTGDVTYLNAPVTALVDGGRVAVVDVAMTNPGGDSMAAGTAELQLPSR
jgi:hypothetical protein